MIALFLNDLAKDQCDNHAGAIVLALLPEADCRLGQKV
jgi:hypothetical protein